MEKLVNRYRGQGRLIFEDDEATTVTYQIEEYQDFPFDGLGREMPGLRDRRGRVSHTIGHPNWHPITSLSPGPFTLVMNDGRKLKVFLRTSEGLIQGTGDFF